MTMMDIAWVAGIAEGEGCFSARKNGRPDLEIVMTDEDVIRRLKSVMVIGNVYGPKVLPSGKSAWTWRVTRQSDAAGAMMTLYPLMGGRRQRKIISILQRWRDKGLPPNERPACKHGHLLSGDNLRICDGGRRRCRTCAKLRMRKHRASRANKIFTL